MSWEKIKNGLGEYVGMTRLTKNFTLGELIKSEIAARHEIDNTPDEETVENLKTLASGLEQIREVLGHKIYVTSGYRCEAVEKILCEKDYKAWCARLKKPVNSYSWKEYFDRKAHPKGFAADWICPEFGTPRECAIAVRDSGIKLDQLIWEFGEWTHTSFDVRMRGDVLTIDRNGTRTGIA